MELLLIIMLALGILALYVSSKQKNEGFCSCSWVGGFPLECEKSRYNSRKRYNEGQTESSTFTKKGWIGQDQYP